MLAQLSPDVQAPGDWSVQADGDWWFTLLLLWVIAAVLFCGLSILLNQLPISFPVRASSRKGARGLDKKLPNNSPTEEPSQRPVPPRPSKPMRVQKSLKEKRAFLRRQGKPIRIFLSNAEATQEPTPGWVVDRSRGGLYIVVRQPVPVGTFLNIRAAHAPDTSPWVRVEIRRCRPRGKRWGLGCRFERELPWGELLLFG
jgi:hypothetical protein